jgi:hypothetical protein
MLVAQLAFRVFTVSYGKLGRGFYFYFSGAIWERNFYHQSRRILCFARELSSKNESARCRTRLLPSEASLILPREKSH